MSIETTIPVTTEVSEADDIHSRFVSRLVGEFFSEGRKVLARELPGFPSAPAEASTSGLKLPALPYVENPYYATSVNSDLPPVHPRVLPATPAATPALELPAGEGAYAYGEPATGFSNLLPHAEQSASPYYFLTREHVAPATREQIVPATPASAGAFDVHRVRRDFPALHQRVNGHPLIWLDNAATTHKPQAVIDATSEFYARDNSNIHRAAHTLAARATDHFENGREKVREFIGAADAKEIAFVRGTTEGINLIAQTYGKQNIGAGDEIIVSTIEHHANIVPWQILAQQTGAVLRVAPVNDRGELILDQFAALLGSRTKLVSITHVANSLGTINPIEEIIALSHAHGVPVLVDGAQSTPHLPVNVQALDADFLVFSGHKIFGPTGIGAVYGKAALLETLPPWQGGGHMIKDVTFTNTVYQHPPERFEAGTPDIAGVVGLAAAIDYLLRTGIPSIAAYEHELLEYATEAVKSVKGLRVIGTARKKASVLSFVVDGHNPEDIGIHLDKYGIAARAGHHCAQPALRRLGVETTVRASFAFYNTREEIDAFIRALHRLGKTR